MINNNLGIYGEYNFIITFYITRRRYPSIFNRLRRHRRCERNTFRENENKQLRKIIRSQNVIFSFATWSINGGISKMCA